MTKLFIATPAYDGKVNVQFAIALAETRVLLEKHGIPAAIRIHTTGSLLCAERNRLLEVFMETDCTHILLIDSDLGWPAEKVLECLQKDVDMIAGCYPSRKEHTFLFRAIHNKDKTIVFDQDKQLIELEAAGAGFMLIKREVIEKMRKQFAHLYYCPKDQSQIVPEGRAMTRGYALFNTEVIDGEFWGEDFVFCRRIRECGYRIWTDPFIQFDHGGNVASLSMILTNDKSKA